MFLGNIGGSLGETSALALLIGGCYLVYRKIINPLVPLTFIATVAAFSAITMHWTGRDPLVDILSGGVMIGAIFMATDYSTTPINLRGKIVFFVGCGIITMVIRIWASLPEGVSYSILLMNIMTPHIEKLTLPKSFGKKLELKERKERKKNEV